MNRGGTEGKTSRRVGAYLYNLAYENRRVIGWLHEDILRNDFTVVEGLSTEAYFSQTACIDQLEHLIRDNKEQRTVLFLSGIISKSLYAIKGGKCKHSNSLGIYTDLFNIITV